MFARWHWLWLRVSLLRVATTSPRRSSSAGLPAQIAQVSGNNEIGQFGAALPQPLVVHVTDANGAPVPAVEVVWSTNGGTFSSDVDSTDNSGAVSVTWTLPATPGNFQATASSQVGSVTFTAQGNADRQPGDVPLYRRRQLSRLRHHNGRAAALLGIQR